MADEMAGTLLHRREIERLCDMPHPPAIERRRRSPVQNPIEIDPARCRNPCIEILRCGFGGEDTDRSGPEMMIERVAQHVGPHRLRQIEMCALAERVHARIGAAGTMDGDMRAAE